MAEQRPKDKKLAEAKISHSFSKRDKYAQCPRLYYEQYIAKSLPYVESENQALGTAVHDALDYALKHNEDINMSELKNKCASAKADYEPKIPGGAATALDEICKRSGLKIAEQEWALGFDFKPCAWFAKKPVMDRAKADVCTVNGDFAWVDDYKTGQAKYVHQEQLVDMAIHVLCRFPHIQKVQATFWMLKETPKNFKIVRQYERGSPEIKERAVQWINIHKEILQRNASGDWPETAGDGCRFCEVEDCANHPSQAY